MAKLYKILNSLEKKELKALEKFLKSPYFNTKSDPLRLFQYLRPFHLRFKKVDKNKLCTALKPDAAFDAKWLNDRFSELSRLVEVFLQTQELARNKELKMRIRRVAFQERGLYPQFLKETQEAIQHLEAKKDQTSSARLALWELYHELYLHPETSPRPDPLILEWKAHSNLDDYYLLHKLAFVANVSGGSKAEKYKLDKPWLTAIRNQAAQGNKAYPLLNYYHQLVVLFHEECTVEGFAAAKEQFLNINSLLAPDERAFMLMKLCNLGSTQVAKGRLVFLPDVMTLYRYGLDDQLFLQNGRLAEGIFLNICVLGAQAKEQEWVLQFIQLYEPHLRLRFKRETLALSRAFLAFHAGDFLEAERQLRDVTSTDLVYRLRIHSLSVRCLLESVLLNISFYHALSSKVRAFKRVIQAKNRLPSAREEAYLNFADVVQGIANFKKGPNSGQQAFLELQEKIQSLSPLVLKAWLSEKLQQVHPKSP